MVRTELWTPVAGANTPTLYEQTGQNLLVGRVGEPEDIAAAYLYLMCNEFSTGAIVQLDGGHVLV